MNSPDLTDVPTEVILAMLSARDSVHVCRKVAETMLVPPPDEDTLFLSTVGVKSMSRPVLYIDGEELMLPHKWVVCPDCNGKGTHVNRAIDGDGISAQDFEEDPDFRDAYFNGDYDVQCDTCKGRTTVEAVDWDKLTEAQKVAYQAQLDDEAADEAMYRAERRMGA